MRRPRTADMLLVPLLLLFAACADAAVMNVRARSVGEDRPCVAEVDGRRMEADEFTIFARQWRGREAVISADVDAPYRCVGGIIFNLQRAGFSRIGFISRPAAPRR